MTKTINTEFKTLRNAYIEVKNFVESETGRKVKSLDTKLVDDLGCAGDDNYELLEKFVDKYKLNYTDFDYKKHFHTEYELFGSTAALIKLLLIPVFISLIIIRILTLGKFKTDSIATKISEIQRPVKDMTVGDLTTWYLEKHYKLREDVKYKIENKIMA